MSEAPRPAPIERVIVPLDAASESAAAIDTAARLAARAKAPLHGVFVEDEDLLHLAALPFAREISLGAATARMTTAHIELSLKAAAERVRRELEAAAARHRVDVTFEVVRGAATMALASASESDFVVAGGETRPISPHFRLEHRWWSSLEVTPGPFLLVRAAAGADGAVVVLLRDRSRAAARLLAAAAHVAHAEERPLTVICSPDVADRAGFEQWIGAELAGSAVRLQIEVAPAAPADLHARITEIGCRLLAIGDADGAGGQLREYVERFACDILTVR